MVNYTKHLMHFNHSLWVIINIKLYEKKIEFNNFYFISEVTIIRNGQKGISSWNVQYLNQNKAISASFFN